MFNLAIFRQSPVNNLKLISLTACPGWFRQAVRRDFESGRRDLNPGLLAPHASALAGLRHAPINLFIANHILIQAGNIVNRLSFFLFG